MSNNEIKVGHDQLIDQIQARMAEEHARGSDASESAAKVKEFLEQTNLNSQAFSWAKTILKKLPKKDGEIKAMDIIRSLEALLPMIKDHVTGQAPSLNLPEPEPEEDDAPEEQEEVQPFDPEEVDDETAEFNAEVDANVDTVVNFGGQA